MADQTFGKQQRLLTASDFQRVFDQHSLKASQGSLLLLAAANQRGLSRIGFIIAKKNIRTAVQRNRIKRLSREYFRTHSDTLSGYDIILLARRGLDQLTNQEIFIILDQQWKRLIRKHQQKKVSD